MKTRLLSITLGLIAWIGLVGAAPHHRLKHDFYVYDGATAGEFVIGAEVTLSWVAGDGYEGGTVSGFTGGRHGRVQFVVPGEPEFVLVTIEADGYVTAEFNVRLGGHPHVGGNGIWLCIYEAAPATK